MSSKKLSTTDSSGSLDEYLSTEYSKKNKAQHFQRADGKLQ